MNGKTEMEAHFADKLLLLIKHINLKHMPHEDGW